MAWLEQKRIGKHTYWYLRWREGGKRRSRYLGKTPGLGTLDALREQRQGDAVLPNDAAAARPDETAQAEGDRWPGPRDYLGKVLAEGDRWPRCVCCGRRAQVLYRGEPVCYGCYAYMSTHEGDCP